MLFENYKLLNQTPKQFFERRISNFFNSNCMTLKALDLVCEEMSKDKGFKRDDGQDFYNHCIDVANTLFSFNIKNEDALCAALLHDIIEDVDGYTYEMIRQIFNKNVAHLVKMVTKEKNINYKEDKNIMNYLENISTNVFSAAIKTADRMHNMMTLNDKTYKARYLKAIETEKFYLPFFKYCRVIYPRYENLFYAARTQIAPLIFHIKDFYTEIERLNMDV